MEIIEIIEKVINTREYLRKKFNEDISSVYWIVTENVEMNINNQYCKDCVEDVFKYLVTPYPEEGEFPNYGFRVSEIENVVSINKDENYFLSESYILSDTPESCQLCSEELSTTLTKYGIEEELKYLEDGVSEHSLYVILQIYESLWYIRDDKLEYLYNRALKILKDYEKLTKD